MSTRRTVKLLFPITITLSVIIITYSIFAQRAFIGDESNTTTKQSTQEKTVTHNLVSQSAEEHVEQDTIIRLRLLEEFENDFLKQYTAPVGCEDWQNDTYMATCMNHKVKAKREFRQEFIKKRGLPKNTFDFPTLSLAD